jgi:hypothetical protein
MSSSHKALNLPTSTIIPSQTVSGNVTSLATNIFFKDNIGIQLVWTGTLAGTFAVNVSNDYNKDTGVGTWTPITLSAVPTASGTPSNAFINIQEIAAPYLQVVFNYTSGSGTLVGTISGKAI